jgi:hypothetical protein
MDVKRVEGSMFDFRTKKLSPHIYFCNMKTEVSAFYISTAMLQIWEIVPHK